MDVNDLIRSATGAAADHVRWGVGVTAVFVGLSEGAEPVTCWSGERPLPGRDTVEACWATLHDNGCDQRAAIYLHDCGGAALATIYADDGEQAASAAVQVERDGTIMPVPASTAAQ
jgi:hypothetical protein